MLCSSDWPVIKMTVMGKKTSTRKHDRIIYLFWFCLVILSPSIFALNQQQQLTQTGFSEELRKAYIQNDDQLADSLIRANRFLVKPFINDLVKECISTELNGKTAESKQVMTIAQKAASNFEEIFGEKSLKIAVNYLTMWSTDQKKTKFSADSIFSIGIKFRLGKEYEKAMEYFPQALNMYKNIGDERGESEVLGHVAVLYFDQADFQSAMAWYREALIKREKVDDKQLTGNTLNSIGSVYLRGFNDYPQAISYYEKAGKLREEIGDTQGLRTTMTYEANAYLRQADQLKISGKYVEALSSLDKSGEIQLKLNSRVSYAEVLSNMGFVYSRLGDYTVAVEKLSEALKIMKEEDDIEGLAGVYNNLGVVLQDAGREEKALEYFNNSLRIYEEKGDLSQVLPMLNNIGTVYFNMGDFNKAEEYHERGLRISRDLNEKNIEVDFLLNLANDQTLLGKLDDAKANYVAGYEVAKSLNNPELIWKITAGMAENYELRGEFEKAIELNDTALTILEGMREVLGKEEFKANFMAKERYAFEDIINMLRILHEKDITKGNDVLAFQYAERSKSRSLLDLLSESDSITNPAYAGMASAHPVTLEEAQALCGDKNTVILEYMVGDSSSCLWVITSTDHQLFKIPPLKELQEQVETIRFALQDPEQTESGFLTTAGYDLYQELIQPAESFLTKKSNLVIIPDGILNYLPFEVLLTENTGKNQEISYADLPYLVKKYSISYGQSASVLKNLLSEYAADQEIKPGNRRLIAFGDPDYGDTGGTDLSAGKQYRRLAYSGKEVEKIASYFREGFSDTYLRDAATEENVKRNGKLNEYDYIHFAAHGYIDEDRPDLSSLVLAQGNNSEEDGLLQAAEIYNLKLNADLVVLSACQTGLGKLVRGEGIVGLTRAFMYAGTPSVLVSLWSVSDISTADLMGEFYESLIKHKLSKTNALRKAQLALLSDDKYAHPFYWASFVLYGDWR